MRKIGTLYRTINRKIHKLKIEIYDVGSKNQTNIINSLFDFSVGMFIGFNLKDFLKLNN